MKTTKITFILMALALIGFNSCEKVEVTNKTIAPELPKVAVNPSGLGSNPGIPYCAPYSFASGIEIIGEMQSTAFKSTDFNKETQKAEEFILNPKINFIPIGSGSLVQIYIKFRNKNSFKQTLIIPAGLILCPEDSTSQTGVIIQSDTLILDPNDSTGVLLKAYCTNLHKGVPHNTKFKMIGTTLHEDLYRMIGILKTKQKLQPGSQAQSIIWNITDHGGLTEEDLNYLNSLP